MAGVPSGVFQEIMPGSLPSGVPIVSVVLHGVLFGSTAPAGIRDTHDRLPWADRGLRSSDTLRPVSTDPNDRSADPNDRQTDATVPDPPASYEIAGFGARFLALAVDWALCLMLAGLVARPPITAYWAYPILIAEYGFFVGLYGQTPGMWLAKVRCVSTTDIGPIGPIRSVLRAVLLCLVVPALIMDSYGRGLHDRAVGSIMLRAPRDRR